MYSADTISGNTLHNVLHGLPIASLYPNPPPYATYDEFVRSRLMKPMTSSTLPPSGKECVIHICDQLPLSEATTPSLKHPINYPPWSVLCIQTDGSLQQEGIHRVGGDVIGLPLPCAVGDVVPRHWYEDLLVQCMGLRKKVLEKSAEIFRLASNVSANSQVVDQRLHQIQVILESALKLQKGAGKRCLRGGIGGWESCLSKRPNTSAGTETFTEDLGRGKAHECQGIHNAKD
nr:uncharacterized protein LOC113711326 [Coffea arabica]